MSSKTVIIAKDHGLASALNTQQGLPCPDSGLPNQAAIITLQHPRHNLPVKFMVVDSRLLELNLVQHVDTRSNPHSWFVGNTVVSDGSLFVASPVNPVFLALPYLEEACKKTSSESGCYVDFTQVLSPVSTSTPETRFISKALLQNPSQLEKMFEVTRVDSISSEGSTILIRTNDVKMIEWLQNRVTKVALALARNSSTSPFYFTTPEGKEQLTRVYFSHKKNRGKGVLPGVAESHFLAFFRKPFASVLQTALDVVGEWISPRLFTLLLESYVFEMDDGVMERCSLKQLVQDKASPIQGDTFETTHASHDGTQEPATKKAKGEFGTAFSTAPKTKAAPKGRTTKAIIPPTGVESIFSFFKKISK